MGHFITVCDAVQYAHDRGVLHRDLKPSNIMLGQYGETFVVDWGLAKADGVDDPNDVPWIGSPADATADARPTPAGVKLGTLDYMSPEQAAGQHEFVGAASDVYGLGATLYHLLTGVPAFASHEPLIRDQEDCCTSSISRNALASGSENSGTREPDASAFRLMSSGENINLSPNQPLDELARRVPAGEFPAPRTVKPQVPRGLEAVCLKAMALRPEDRYGSARELAADIERWLADEAVTALADSFVGRCGRWARRHRPFVAAMLGLLVTAVIALAVGTILLNRERELTVAQRNRAVASDKSAQEQRRSAERNESQAVSEAKRANEQAQRADLEAQRAAQKAAEVEQVSNFLVNLFRTADPLSLRGSGFSDGTGSGAHLTATELLQRGAKRIDELHEQPLVQATLLENLGDVSRDLGDYESSKTLLDRAWELRRKWLERNDPAIAETALSLGRWHQDQGHFPEAQEFYEQALSIRQQHWPNDSLPVAEVRFYQGWLLCDRDRSELAEPIFRQVWQVREKLLGPHHAETQTAKVFLAVTLADGNRLLESITMMAADLPIAEIPRGILEYRAAESLRGQKQFDAARARLEPLVQRATELLGERHPMRAMLLGDLAGIARQQGHWSEARRFTEEAMSVLEPIMKNHPRQTRPLAQVAAGLVVIGRYDEAERRYRHALRLVESGRRENVAQMHIEFCESTAYEVTKYPDDLMRHVECLLELGHDEQAAVARDLARRRMASEAIKGRRDHAPYHTRLAQAAMQFEDFDLAELHFRFAVVVSNSQRPVGDTERLQCVVDLGRYLRQRGKLDEARQVLEEAVQQLAASVGEHELPTTAARLELAQTYKRLGEPQGVSPRTGDAPQVRGLTPPGSPESMNRGIELARDVLNDRLRELGANHPAVAEAQRVLADLLSNTQPIPREEITTLLASAHTATRNRFGPAHPLVFEIAAQRAEFLRSLGQLDEAERLLEVTRREAPDTLPPTSIRVLLLDGVAGAIALDRRDFETAEKLLTFAYQRLQLTVGRRDPRTLRQAERCARLYDAWKKPDEAAKYRALLQRSR